MSSHVESIEFAQFSNLELYNFNLELYNFNLEFQNFNLKLYNSNLVFNAKAMLLGCDMPHLDMKKLCFYDGRNAAMALNDIEDDRICNIKGAHKERKIKKTAIFASFKRF